MKAKYAWLVVAVMSFLGAMDSHAAMQQPGHSRWWSVLTGVCITGVIMATSAYTRAEIKEVAKREAAKIQGGHQER